LLAKTVSPSTPGGSQFPDRGRLLLLIVIVIGDQRSEKRSLFILLLKIE
jgi:hypothetical protein